MSSKPVIATIGYEKTTLDEVIGKLKAAGVETLVDVRAIAASRRPGFSKRLLAGSLEEAGIEYVHLRGLGTPKAGREAARAGRVAEMREIYEEHLKTPEAETDFARAAEIARTSRPAFLCYEGDAAGCHRRVVTERLVALLGAEVRDL